MAAYDKAKQKLIVFIAARARDYNWHTEATHVERHGKTRHGFGHEVGQAVTLFMAPPPLGGLLQSRQEYADCRDNDRAHAGLLIQLRVWIAKLNILNRSN